MPRTGKPGGERQRERQRRYRGRLRALGQPEASAVDIAVAAAVAGYAAQAAGDPSANVRVLKGLLRDAVERLVAGGHTRGEARRIVIRRIGRYAHSVPGGEPGP